MRGTDQVAVAGGGPAGAAAALLLARAGHPVTVFERDASPAHKVCGEFIGGDGLAHLAALGVDPWRLGAAPIVRLRLIRKARWVEARLPFAAAGLSRRSLDAALLHAAEAAGARVLRGCAIRRLRSGVLEAAGQDPIIPRALFLATGKHELRGARRIAARGEGSVGFKLHLTLAPAQAAALGGAIELLLFRDSYAGLQPIEDGRANLCLLTTRARLAAGGGWRGLLEGLCRDSPHLAERLDGARGWPKPLAIAGVPYGFLSPEAEPGLFRLGDQMGVIHSFAGDGIAIALHTAALAAGCFLAGESFAMYHHRARADIGGAIRLSSVLYRSGRIGAAQAAMMGAARLWPGVLGHLAGLTRGGSFRPAH